MLNEIKDKMPDPKEKKWSWTLRQQLSLRLLPSQLMLTRSFYTGVYGSLRWTRSPKCHH